MRQRRIQGREGGREGRRDGEETGKQRAAEITAIIAIEVRTGRCLLNPIENRRRGRTRDTLLLLPHSLTGGIRSNGGEESVVQPEKNGRTAPFNPRVNGAYPARR